MIFFCLTPLKSSLADEGSANMIRFHLNRVKAFMYVFMGQHCLIIHGSLSARQYKSLLK